jgi:hypothetical protein
VKGGKWLVLVAGKDKKERISKHKRGAWAGGNRMTHTGGYRGKTGQLMIHRMITLHPRLNDWNSMAEEACSNIANSAGAMRKGVSLEGFTEAGGGRGPLPQTA